MNRSVFMWMVMLLIGINVRVAQAGIPPPPKDTASSQKDATAQQKKTATTAQQQKTGSTAAQRPPANATAPMPGSVDCEWLIDLWVEGDKTGEARTWFRYVAYRAAMRFGPAGRLNPRIYAEWTPEQRAAWQRNPGQVIHDGIINTVLADAKLRGRVVHIRVVPIVSTLYAIFAMLYTTERLNTHTLTSEALRQLANTEENMKRLGPTVTEDAMYRFAWAHTTENAPLEEFWWKLNDFIIKWNPPPTKPVLDGRGSQQPVREFTYRGVHALADAAITALDDSIRRNSKSPGETQASVNQAQRHLWHSSDPSKRQLLLQYLAMIIQQESVAACSPALQTTVVLYGATHDTSMGKSIIKHENQYGFTPRTPLGQSIVSYSNSPLYWNTLYDRTGTSSCVVLRYNLNETPNPSAWAPPFSLITTILGYDYVTQAVIRAHNPAQVLSRNRRELPLTRFVQLPYGTGTQHPSVPGDGSWPPNWLYGFINPNHTPRDEDALIVETTKFGMPGQLTCLGAYAHSYEELVAMTRYVSQQPQDQIAARTRDGTAAYVDWINRQLGVDLPFDE
jgi:hypothetical protein